MQPRPVTCQAACPALSHPIPIPYLPRTHYLGHLQPNAMAVDFSGFGDRHGRSGIAGSTHVYYGSAGSMEPGSSEQATADGASSQARTTNDFFPFHLLLSIIWLASSSGVQAQCTALVRDGSF